MFVGGHERPLSGDHLIEHDAEREDVGGRARLLAGACSGDIYAAVPSSVPGVGRPGSFGRIVRRPASSTIRARPKSRTLT